MMSIKWEKINEKFVVWILRILQTKNYGKNTEQKVRYSLLVLLSEFEKFFCLILLFGLLHRLLEFFILFFTIISLRMFMGGSHRKTMLGCFVWSFLMFMVAMTISEYITMNEIVKYLIHSSLLIEIWASTPISSANRIKYNKVQIVQIKARALTVMLILTWVEGLLPDTYNNLMISGMLVQMLEVAVVYIYQREKERRKVYEKAERNIE